MSSSRLRIVVSGLIAQYPLGGVTWDYLQYVVGLARLGHDVYYMEDTGQWPYNPVEGGTASSGDYNAGFLAGIMQRFGLQDRWAYRFPGQNQWYGLAAPARMTIIRSADLLINVSGSLARPADYRPAGRSIYIDSDPVFTQAKLARGQQDFRAQVDAHDIHFSFGETLGPGAPDSGHRWLPTRQPILLDEWAHELAATRPFTTVMNWSSYKPVECNGVRYGQKDVEFLKFVDLPVAAAPARLEIALAAGSKNGSPPLTLLRLKGWKVVAPADVASNIDDYRNYVQTSLAEWSVAKNGYVAGRSGWFSCRSACYLAAGRPVVTQDTGFSEFLPTGTGLLSFTTFDEALQAIQSVVTNPQRHQQAARALADEYFRADRVLTHLLERAFGQP